ncbi:helix-turn-helix domain-containing protein [Streptomyces griseofuscus]|uniref:helix-turn-helix domain-containing protein n=1 Tax=Streptomyces TaxID=1883 RepID=UPI0027DE07C3|nr:helix-turn-helix domain-containing protein [Streptomyces sp. CRPSP2-6A1]
MAEPVRVREIDDEEGRSLLRIIRRGTGSVVTWRRAQTVLLSAQGMPVPKIAEVSFTSTDRVRDVLHNFNTDGFASPPDVPDFLHQGVSVGGTVVARDPRRPRLPPPVSPSPSTPGTSTRARLRAVHHARGFQRLPGGGLPADLPREHAHHTGTAPLLGQRARPGRERLLTIHGSQRALAKRLHRSQGWVSQRVALLNLIPELQARIGEEPIDLLRAVGNKPADQQEAALDELRTERARKEEAKERPVRAWREQAADGHPDTVDTARPADYAVITNEAEAEPLAVPMTTTSQDDPQPPLPRPHRAYLWPAQQRRSRPPPGADHCRRSDRRSRGPAQPKRFPHHDGMLVAQLLIHKMLLEEFRKMLNQLLKHRDGHTVPRS